MSKRVVVRIQLDLEAKDSLDELCRRRGMTQIAIMSRLVGWFVNQDEIVQASILGSLSDERLAPVARRLLEQIAAADPETGPK